MSDISTKLRISVSRKNKKTGEYEQDFSGFVLAIGTAVASKAARLQQGARIQLGDVDVSTKYDREKKITYTNYKLFSFHSEEETHSPSCHPDEPEPGVDDGEFEESSPRLPF